MRNPPGKHEARYFYGFLLIAMGALLVLVTLAVAYGIVQSARGIETPGELTATPYGGTYF